MLARRGKRSFELGNPKKNTHSVVLVVVSVRLCENDPPSMKNALKDLIRKQTSMVYFQSNIKTKRLYFTWNEEQQRQQEIEPEVGVAANRQEDTEWWHEERDDDQNYIASCDFNHLCVVFVTDVVDVVFLMREFRTKERKKKAKNTNIFLHRQYGLCYSCCGDLSTYESLLG